MRGLPAWIAAGFLPLVYLIGCQDEAMTPTAIPTTPLMAAAVITDNVVAKVAVIPDSQIVFVGDRFRITAQPKNAAGQVLVRTVRWTVSDLRIAKALDSLKAVATFKGLRAGIVSIKATADGKSRSAKRIVRGTAGAKVVVTPATATIVSGKTLRFVATGLTQTGETAAVEVTWTVTGGTVSGGTVTAGKIPGTYRVIAKSRFGAADTSAVIVTGAAAAVSKVFLVPATASTVPGAKVPFAAYGRTSAGDSVSVAVTYSSTGGTVATSGVYTAGAATGTYRVIAKNAAGIADTSPVTITAAAAAPVAKVTLMPDIAASRPEATTQFVASAWNASGTTVPKAATYQTTCGTVTSAGLFTAPGNDTGTCLVISTVDDKADTTEVALLRKTSVNQGVPYGLYALWTSGTAMSTSGTAAFTASHDYVSPGALVSHIATARAKGVRLVLPMTGGGHSQYTTDGVFDLAKWQAAMNAYNTPAIRAAVAEAVADGTIIGNSVMDEPHQSDGARFPEKSWGPPGTMTKARVDGLCAYVKTIFPTLPAGVGHDHAGFDVNNSYKVCDFIIDQYVSRKGPISAWLDAALALKARDGVEIIFSLNVLNGAAQDRTGAWDCPGTGGLGSFSPNCRMTPAQVRDWGKLLGQVGCAMLGWRYDATFMGKPENRAAMSDVALTLAGLPRKPCLRKSAPPPANVAPTASFAQNCSHLACAFTDESSDDDGDVTEWSWDFGDGNTSTTRDPSHTYGEAGGYQVTLTVTDDDDATGTLTRTVNVTAPPPENVAPSAGFTSSCSDLACAFTDESTDGDGDLTQWSWDFGDGNTSTTRHPSHTYDQAGGYQVILTVTDDDDATGTVTHSVTVTAPAPENVAPTAGFTSDCTELTCTFTDESTDADGGTVTSWSWDFGDGSSSTERHPSHTYAVEGSYQVTLVVTDDDEATGTITQSVTATTPAEPPEGP